MKIGGLQKFSMIDYPGKVACIIFTQGCNFACSYCHNPELVDPKRFTGLIDEEEIFKFLQERKGKLDAVVITGGEPTLHFDLLEFIRKIKELGFLVKLDTNGTNPEMLEKLLNEKLVDYLAMDIKAPLSKYEKIIQTSVDIQKIKKSIELIMKAKEIDYEFRTTIVKSLLTPEDILQIGEEIKGAKKYFLQKFIPSKTLDQKMLDEESYSDTEIEEFKKQLSNFVAQCLSR